MLVVFDTNIWKSDLYLRSHSASAVRAYLRLHDAKVGLPEVVELEVKRHLLTDIKRYRDRVQEDHRRLLALFGKLREVVLPNDDEIDELVENSIDSVGLPISRVPFTEAAARASFIGTINKKRPSHRSQQFRDGVLWENCISMAEEEAVILVTDDRAFFENDNVEQGLAKELQSELEETGIDLRVVSSLSALLDKIRKPLEVDQDQLSKDVREQIGKQMEELAERNGFSIIELDGFDVQFFATENPENLFVEVNGQFQCEDVSGMDRPLGVLEFACDGSFNMSEHNYVNLKPNSLTLTYVNEESEKVSRGDVFVTAGFTAIGHRTIDHKLRVPLS